MGLEPARHGPLPRLDSSPTAFKVSRDLREANVHSFIVRIWVEETAEEAGRATWRGHITHVASGQRRYVRGLGDIVAFVGSYLEEMGVDLGKRWRLGRWLGRLRR